MTMLHPKRNLFEHINQLLRLQIFLASTDLIINPVSQRPFTFYILCHHAQITLPRFIYFDLLKNITVLK